MMNRTSTVSVFTLGLLLTALLVSGCAHSKESTDTSVADHSGTSKVFSGGSELHAEEIDQSEARSVEEVLEGRVSGVHVTRASDGGLQLRLRGVQSISGSNEPLIVIDDRALPRWHSGSIPVSPHDIESIRVLKSISDLSFYGSRGANGVIYIKTKRGS